MDLYNLYATDPKLEQEGKEFDFGGGVSMLIARSYNPSYNRMLNARFEEHKHTLELKNTPEEQKVAEDRSNKIMAEVYSHTILLGWSGPVTYKGEPLPYSIANAQKLLMMKDFQRDIAKRADDFKNFRVATEEADVKNLSTSSGGTSPGEAVSSTS